MKWSIRYATKVFVKNYNLEPQFNVVFDEVRNIYHKFLEGYKTVKLKNAIAIQSVHSARKGDLIAETKYFKQLRIRILDKDIQNKSLTIITIKDSRISKNHLIWSLSQKPIADYISLHSIGTVISYIPLSSILEIKIPLIKKHSKMTSLVIQSGGEFKDVVENYLISEFYKCKQSNLYLAAIVLSGSIVESLISQLLINNGIKQAHLKNKTLGALIEFAKIEEVIDKDFASWALELSQLRNHIHATKLVKQPIDVEKSAERAYYLFNQIVKEIGM